MRHTWGAVTLTVPRDCEEELAGWLVGDGLGASAEPAPGGRSLLRIFVDTPAEARAAIPDLERRLAGAGHDPASCNIRVEAVEDRSWAERHQASLAPFELGRRFLILPAGGAGRPGRRSILLPPTRAFGTGEHATTRMCGEALERLVLPGSRWIDLGCGTAILALVAHHCGAARVLGLDLEAEAVAVARETLDSNGVATIPLVRGSIGTACPGWSGIVANLHAPFFLQSGADLSRALDAGGWLIASGFLLDDLDPIARGLESAGIRETERGADGEWALLVARKADRG